MKIYCKNKIIKNLVVNKNKILNENNKNKPIKSLCNVVICTKKTLFTKHLTICGSMVYNSNNKILLLNTTIFIY